MDESLARLQEVPIEVMLELDDGLRIQARDILGWQVGSILRTSRPCGEDLTVLLAGVAVGTGEIVALDDEAAVRITAIKFAG